MNDTAELLRAWVEHGSEDAFAKLVAGHVDLVYSVAVRKVAGDSGLAAEVAQTVFTDLARKARTLRAEGSLAGWLHRHTCYIAATALRGELRRRAREQTAATMHALENSTEPDWSRLAPLLDDAVNALGETDRRAILLRFFERHDLRSVGDQLGVGDDTAQKRISRALEKLRHWLARRGVSSSAGALAGILGAQSVVAAPTGLATTVTAAALTTTGVTVGAGTFTLFEIMTHVKAKLAVAAAVTAAVVAPVVWQENAIATVRTENRTLAGQVESLRQTRTEPSQASAPPVAGDTAARESREREDLARLRSEVAGMREQLQMAQTAIQTAARNGVRAERTPPPLRPGFMSLQDARDMGSSTPEALFQSLLYAFRTGNTNRIVELGDWTEEGAREEIEKMARDIASEMANGGFEEKAAGMAFRAVRVIPLDDGDSALVAEMGMGEEMHREAIRMRRVGNEWRMVIGKGGPAKVKLTEEQLQQ